MSIKQKFPRLVLFYVVSVRGISGAERSNYMQGQGVSYNVDIVMCIDVTGSMGGLLETVKSNALKFYPDLKACCEAKDRVVDEVRIRVIAFRDFNADRDLAIQDTGFFNIPAQEGDFKSFVSDLVPAGGGDEPENGLEALAMAMNSDWTKGGSRRRHIIVVWSDASTHPLEASLTKNEFYPSDMPKNFDELTDWWEDERSGKMDKLAKRLIVFAPDASAWNEIGTNWTNAIHHTAKAGTGLSECDYGTILTAISNSI